MADLTVTVTESIILNNAKRGSTNTVTIPSIIDTFERVVTCPHSQTTTIATFSTNVYDGSGDIDAQGVKYCRVTNLSTTIDMEVAVVGASTLYQVLIPASQTHIICRADDAMLAEADTSPSFGTMQDIASIQVRPTTASDTQVEIFVASI
jgi:hypothetical protein|tara:strand:+ start:83 stop:532 length:450 start_codon:yes stop_codon:yes gene_type:complete